MIYKFNWILVILSYNNYKFNLNEICSLLFFLKYLKKIIILFFLVKKSIFFIIWILPDIVNFLSKKNNYFTWNTAYDFNKIYTPVSYILDESEKDFQKITQLIKIWILLIIHKYIVFAQSFFLFYYLINSKKRSIKINSNNFFSNIFLKAPQLRAIELIEKIKLKKLSLNDFKTILQNLIFILNIGWSRWSINNCLILNKILNNSIKNRRFKITSIIKYSEKKILEKTLKDYEKKFSNK